MGALSWFTPKVFRNAFKAGRALLAKVDFSVLIGVMLKLAELEREMSQPGSGSQKFAALIHWTQETFPKAAAWIDEVVDFVNAAVALFNALGWFRK